MVQPKTSKTTFISFIIGISILLVMTGCSSGNSETNEQASDYEQADETALAYTKARYEYDIPVMFDLSIDEVQDDYLNDEDWFRYFTKTDGADLKSDPPMDDLIDPAQYKDIKAEYDSEDYEKNHDDFFRDFEKDGERYLYAVRFNDLFGEDSPGYFIKPWLATSSDGEGWNRDNKSDAGYLKVEQEDGSWKIEEVRKVDFTDKGIDVTDKDEIKKQGTVIHELEKEK